MKLDEKVLAKVYGEQGRFRTDLLLHSKPSAIYEKAYEICYKNEIVNLLEVADLPDNVYEKLLEQENILEFLYQEWLDTDCSVCEMIEDMIRGVVEWA